MSKDLFLDLEKYLEIGQSLKSRIYTKKEELTEIEKLKAAYALNMCMVSVSQIIDYHDVAVLEQEYEAILNNLNLENIPKDEALLNILRQILDTVTFFRISEGEKEMIEKEYQHKLKNALWASAPDLGVIVAGGDIKTMVISLVTQVGIGYMNYRRNKADYLLEKNRKYWELRKTAIEQFNALRRELFDTAWRLSDTYEFPDNYRLTEKQIAQYNKILMDEDKLRMYERLEAIQDNFEAYPPFWYFIGNAANYIANNSEYTLSEFTRKEYKEKAKAYFEKFRAMNKFNILREDSLSAACCLEYAELLMMDNHYDELKIKELLKSAVEKSGHSFDVLELCAISYVRIGDFDNAKKLLKILVNENYNRVMNAQLLSSIYVKTRDRIEYEILSTRVDRDYLYPMPSSNVFEIKMLQDKFESNLKNNLVKRYLMILEDFLTKYVIKWNQITSVFNPREEYEDIFFLDDSNSRAKRLEKARKVFGRNSKKELYYDVLSDGDFRLNMLDVMNSMFEELFKLNAISNLELHDSVNELVKDKLINYKDKFNAIQTKIEQRVFSLKDYVEIQKLPLSIFVIESFKIIEVYIKKLVKATSISGLTNLESDLRIFCLRNELEFYEIAIGRNVSKASYEFKKEFLTPEIFGQSAINSRKNKEFLQEMSNVIKKKMETIRYNNAQLDVYYRNSEAFNTYFYDSKFRNYPDLKQNSIAVFKDGTAKKNDLIFTTDGIVNVTKEFVRAKTPYDEIEMVNNKLRLSSGNLLFDYTMYESPTVTTTDLFSLIKDLNHKFVRDIEEKVEYINGVLNASVLMEWFKNKPEATQDNCVCICATPKKEVLQSLGYTLDTELNEECNVLQMYYEKNSKKIQDYRIVRFDKINSNLQSKLCETGYFTIQFNKE